MPRFVFIPPNKMEISHLFLPKKLLEHFKAKQVLELYDIKTKEEIIEIHLDEKNTLPNGYKQSNYESKGFYTSKRIQDFPIRGKALYLCIKRRVWRNKNNPNKTVKSDYSFISEGSK